jgi:hypothetical protein
MEWRDKMVVVDSTLLVNQVATKGSLIVHQDLTNRVISLLQQQKTLFEA